MNALILPTRDDRLVEVIKTIADKGHSAEMFQEDGSKMEFLDKLGYYNTLLAFGELLPKGIFLWGYAAAKNRKVIAFKGVNPLFCTHTLNLYDWLNALPIQTRLFQESR